MKIFDNFIGNLAISILALPFLVWIGVGLYDINMMVNYSGDMEFLSMNEFSIPVAQIVSYVFISTLSFFFRRYKMGLMVSFSYVFYWGFVHGSEIFIDKMGKATPGLIIYLFCGLMLAVLVVVGFFREE